MTPKEFTISTLCAMLYLIPMSQIIVMYYISLYTFKGCNWLIDNCPLDKWMLALNNKLLTNHNNERN